MMWQDLKLYSVQERRGLCPLVPSNTIDVTGRKMAHKHKKKKPTKHKNPPPTNQTQLEIYCFVLLHIFYITFS